MTETERQPYPPVGLRRPVSFWAASLPGVAGIAGLGALTVLPGPFHVSPCTPLGWVLAVLIGAPAYMILEVVVDVVLEAWFGASRRAGKAVVLSVLAGFYLVWFYLHL